MIKSSFRSAPQKEETSDVQAVLEQWQEEVRSMPATEQATSNFDSATHSQVNKYDDDDIAPPPVCFSVDESDNVDSAESVTLAAANALRGIELRSRDSSLHPDDQASVYDKVMTSRYCDD